MNATWDDGADGDDYLDSQLRNIDHQLTEMFAADLDDPDQVVMFLDQIDRQVESERERSCQEARSHDLLSANGPASNDTPPAPLPNASATINLPHYRLKTGRTVLCLTVVLILVIAISRLPITGSPAAANFGTVDGLEKPDPKISIMTTTDLIPFWYAVKRGYFEDAGFTFDPRKDVTVARSGTDSVGKLVAKQADIVYSTYTPFFVAESKGEADINLVADASSAGPHSCMVVAGPDSRIRSIKDMAGARVAVTSRNTISDLMIMSTLKTNGIDHSTIQWVETPFPDMAAKLASGEVDVAFLTEPFLTQAQLTAGAVPLFDTATGPTANLPTAGFGADAEFVRNYPRTVTAFQRVMERATAEAKADRPEVEKLLQEFAGVDANIAKLATLLTFQSSLDATRIQRVMDLMLEFGVVSERIDVSQMIAKSPATR